MHNEACLAFVCKSDFVKFLQEGPFSPLPMLCLSHFICIFAMPKKGVCPFKAPFFSNTKLWKRQSG